MMFKEISPRIFAFISENEGSNCFLLKGTKEIALIDSSSEENKDAIVSGIEALGIRLSEVSLVLHTHGHADHFGLNSLFKHAKIAMHRLDAEKIAQEDKEFACTQFFPGTRMPEISLILEDKQEIDLGEIKLLVLPTPGHTAGSVCFFLEEEKALFSGDSLFATGFGRTDLPTGNAQKMLESLKKLQKIPFSVLLPGHGPILQGETIIGRGLREIVAMAGTNAFL